MGRAPKDFPASVFCGVSWRVRRKHVSIPVAPDAAHSLPRNIGSVVPWLGSPFKTGLKLTDVVFGLATDVLQPSGQSAYFMGFQTNSEASGTGGLLGGLGILQLNNGTPAVDTSGSNRELCTPVCVQRSRPPIPSTVLTGYSASSPNTVTMSWRCK